MDMWSIQRTMTSSARRHEPDDFGDVVPHEGLSLEIIKEGVEVTPKRIKNENVIGPEGIPAEVWKILGEGGGIDNVKAGLYGFRDGW